MTATASPALADGREANEGLLILVVEDDQDLTALYGEFLAELGSVEACPDAYQALARLEAEPFDVVLLDLLLPGANGVDLLDRLRSKGIDVPVVVVSESGDGSGLVHRARLAGAEVVMEKPVDRGLLAFSVVRAALGRGLSSSVG